MFMQWIMLVDNIKHTNNIRKYIAHYSYETGHGVYYYTSIPIIKNN